MLRTLARTLMATAFIHGGVQALRSPAEHGDIPQDTADDVAEALPISTNDPEDLVRINGAVQVGAGGLLALNIAPRPAAAVLAASLIPSTAAEHRFWETDGEERREHLRHFVKNLALFGGLVITAMDTQGKPGVAWRAGHAVDHATEIAGWKRREAELLADLARERAKAAIARADADHIAPAQQAVKDATRAGRSVVKAVKVGGRAFGRSAKAGTKGATKAAKTSAKGATATVRTTGKGAVKAAKALTPA